jgi:putative nucleotidyltransferase with HDIG domain
MLPETLAGELDCLLRDTYVLWDPGWVTFNWRAYTYDHVQRVRGLALNLCAREGGAADVVKLAALLHDITKPYDGEYLLDGKGSRVLDAHGHWRNEVRFPRCTNEVTDLYERLELAGRLHNESGAEIAEVLLASRGLDGRACRAVAAAIRDHLQPPRGATVESLCLYEADTIDANVGLPAFVRNIYINLHFHDGRKSPEDPPIDVVLRQAPLDFLRPYITENLPRWAEGKRRDFLPRLLTASGREIAAARLERLGQTLAILADELADSGLDQARGCLAAVMHFMRRREEPSITAEIGYLAREWLSRNGATPQARELVLHLQRESAGVE